MKGGFQEAGEGLPRVSLKSEATVIDSHTLGVAYKRDSGGHRGEVLVGEGGVIPLQLGLPGSALPLSAPAHPSLHLLLVAGL